MMNEIIRKLITNNSHKPLAELLKAPAHLRFRDEEYASRYCEAHCPHRYADYNWECPGGCKTWDYGMKDGTLTVYGAEILIGEILRDGYHALGVKGINEPFTIEEGSYAKYDWDNSEKGICSKCEYYGKAECPEDILSAECPRSGDAWAVERITEAVNEVLKCSL